MGGAKKIQKSDKSHTNKGRVLEEDFFNLALIRGFKKTMGDNYSVSTIVSSTGFTLGYVKAVMTGVANVTINVLWPLMRLVPEVSLRRVIMLHFVAQTYQLGSFKKVMTLPQAEALFLSYDPDLRPLFELFNDTRRNPKKFFSPENIERIEEVAENYLLSDFDNQFGEVRLSLQGNPELLGSLKDGLKYLNLISDKVLRDLS